jgi:hypothetical protein
MSNHGEIMFLKSLEKLMAAKLDLEGITAEVTFCREDMFSILVEDAAQFEKAKALFALVPTARFDSEVQDDEVGHVAYYSYI